MHVTASDSSSTIKKQRQTLRRHYRRLRQQISPQQQQQAAKALAKNLINSAVFMRATNIAAYWPDDGEISLLPTIELAFAMKKKIFLPLIAHNQSMHFAKMTRQTSLAEGRWGILQPQSPAKIIKPYVLDILLVPVVAFDLYGNRLGRGGGFYDRYLAKLQRPSARLKQPSAKPVIIGVAHQQQQIDQLPIESWDVPLNAVVSNTGVCYFR